MFDDCGTPLLCLRSGEQDSDWYLEQVHAFAGLDWAATGKPDDDEFCAQAERAIATQAGGGPVHLLATGVSVPRALRLAARRPELVTSVLIGDPIVEGDAAEYWQLLAQVQAPTLVLVAAPGRDADTSAAQAIAGGVDNGVLVIVDDATAPVHQRAAASFNEWVTSFMSIAEGLRAITDSGTEGRASGREEEAHA